MTNKFKIGDSVYRIWTLYGVEDLNIRLRIVAIKNAFYVVERYDGRYFDRFKTRPVNVVRIF